MTHEITGAWGEAMTHAEWIQARVADLLRSVGKIDHDMEGDALIGMMCLCIETNGCVQDVGATVPSALDKEVATAYWEYVANNPPPLPGDRAKRERLLEAVDRFEREMGFAPPKEST